ncbi:transposase [Janthinobacterium sp. CAN_S1]|uniref:ISL3 family transposase n=1 Tax=Janthinobacterium sp. CAN_S1 TaxID=2787725 RepID=UPI0018C9ED17
MTTPASLLYPLTLTVTAFKQEEYDYHFHVEASEPNTCPGCGVVDDLVKFGKRDQAFRDVPIHGKRVTLWVNRRRYRCNSCMSTFRPVLEDMDESRTMTKRLMTYIEKAVLYRTNNEIARECGIEEKTVRLVFAAFVERQKGELDFVTPRVLGVDELYLQKQFCCVLTNIEQQTVIELLPNRSLELVKATFMALPDRKNVEVLSTDMYKNYLEAGRHAFPDAKPVVDKFHVVKMANEAMEVVRKSIKKDLSDYHRKLLKNDRKLMLMRERDLTPATRLVIAEWFDKIPALGAAYASKERFFKLYDAKDLKEATLAYDEWRKTIPAGQEELWGGLAGTVDRWRGPIFNYFTMDYRVTNAFTESANRKMKDLNRATRGMSFESFRAKVLLGAKHKVVRSRVAKASPFDGTFMGRWTPDMMAHKEEVLNYGTPLSTMDDILYGNDPAA